MDIGLPSSSASPNPFRNGRKRWDLREETRIRCVYRHLQIGRYYVRRALAGKQKWQSPETAGPGSRGSPGRG
jgi:hypothetical protein